MAAWNGAVGGGAAVDPASIRGHGVDDSVRRVRSRSFIPAMFEWCGCNVSVERIGRVCSDDEPEAADTAIEVELIDGELLQTSRPTSGPSLPTSTPFAVESRQRPDVYGQQQRADVTSISNLRSPPATHRSPTHWSTHLRSARNRHEQNVEMIFAAAAVSTYWVDRRRYEQTDVNIPLLDGGGRLHRQEVPPTIADCGCIVRLRTTRAIRASEELAVWYSDDLGRLVGVPSLVPSNIRGSQCYACVHCSRYFRNPNPLKGHMMSKCHGTALSVVPSSFPPFGIELCPPHPTTMAPFFPLPGTTTDDDQLSRRFNETWLPRSLGGAIFHSPGLQYFPITASRNVALERRRMESLRPLHPIQESAYPLVDKATSFIASTAVHFEANAPLWSTKLRPSTAVVDAVGTKSQSTSTLVQLWRSFADVLPVASSEIENNSETDRGSPSTSITTSPIIDIGQVKGRDLWDGNDETISVRVRHGEPIKPTRSSHWDRLLSSEGSFNGTTSLAEICRRNCRQRGDENDRLMPSDGRKTVLSTQPPSDWLRHHEFVNESICLEERTVIQPAATAIVDSEMTRSKSSMRSSSTSSVCSSSPCPSPSSSAAGTASRRRDGQLSRHASMTHRCVHCGKLYSRRYGLTIHLRTHSGDKPLECPVCGRPFGDPSNLNKHVRLHAAAAASAVAAAGGGTSRPDGMRVEDAAPSTVAALRAIKDSPYRCKHCGKVLVRRRDLERHIRSRHPNVATIDATVVSRPFGGLCRATLMT